MPISTKSRDITHLVLMDILEKNKNKKDKIGTDFVYVHCMTLISCVNKLTKKLNRKTWPHLNCSYKYLDTSAPQSRIKLHLITPPFWVIYHFMAITCHYQPVYQIWNALSPSIAKTESSQKLSTFKNRLWRFQHKSSQHYLSIELKWDIMQLKNLDQIQQKLRKKLLQWKSKSLFWGRYVKVSGQILSMFGKIG